MHKNICGLIAKMSWLITGLAALNIGLDALNIFDFFKTEFILKNPSMQLWIEYAIGLAGAWALFGLTRQCYQCVSGACICCKS